MEENTKSFFENSFILKEDIIRGHGMHIILTIIALYIFVIIYESGHFISAKLNKVKVEEFSIGMGPKVISKQGKETLYRLNVIPIGGYIKMLGDCEINDEESSFLFKSSIRKISIILSGIFMTLIVLGILIIGIIYSNGYRLTTIKNELTSQNSTDIFLQGDQILKVNNIDVKFGEDIIYEMELSGEKEMNFLIARDGEKKIIYISNWKDQENLCKMNLALDKVDNPTITESIKVGFNRTIKLIDETYRQFWRMITKDINLRTYISGLFEVVKMSTETIRIGIYSFFNLLVYIGITLGLFNILPLPVLDGGKFLIELFQAVTKTKISRKILMILDLISIITILGLIIFTLI